MPLRATSQRDTAPLLASSSSVSTSDGIRATDPPASRNHRGGGIRRLLFSSSSSSSSSARSDPPGDRPKPRTVDTRNIIQKKKQDPVEEKAVPMRFNNKYAKTERSPPRPLQENSRDTHHGKKRYLPSIQKQPHRQQMGDDILLPAKDPPAVNGKPNPAAVQEKPARKQELLEDFANFAENEDIFQAIMNRGEEKKTQERADTTGTAGSSINSTNQEEEEEEVIPTHHSSPQKELDDLRQQEYQRRVRQEQSRVRQQRYGQHQQGTIQPSHSSGGNSTETGDSAGTSYQVVYARHDQDGTENIRPVKQHASQLTSRLPPKSTPAKSKTRGLLSRPFGRAYLPPEIARKWVVEVSSAEWDADEKRWKYRILIQRRRVQSKKKRDGTKNQSSIRMQQSFTNAFTWRSLADFCWLENALRKEYQGGLLLPDLSIALGRPLCDDANLEETPVEAERLRNWLSDVMNGVRGQGELLFDHSDEVVDLLRSESMEAFLYRNGGDALRKTELSFAGTNRGTITPPVKKSTERQGSNSFLHNLNALLLSPLELCVGPQSSEYSTTSFPQKLANSSLPVIACQSRALSTAPSLDVNDSMAETADVSTPRNSSGIAVHSELIQAEKELVLHYRKTSLLAMEKLQQLQRQEEKLGAAWQRLAISLSNLFAFEKDVESIRLGDSKVRRGNMPFRKLAKATVDDSLRVFSRQKFKRSLPALDALSDMLGAYVADLSSVEPSVIVYLESMNHFTLETNSQESLPQSGPTAASQHWDAKIKALAAATREHAMRSFGTHVEDDSAEKREVAEKIITQHAERTRFLANEKLLRQGLTTMCRSIPVRVSRMAWRYLNTEASHCAVFHASAVKLRKNLTASKGSVSKMLNRHHQEEKDDDAAEIALVERLLNFGILAGRIFNQSKTGRYGGTDDEHSRSRAHEKVRFLLGTRRGRWDASTAVSLLEAVGVDETDVKVDETTRELRMVRKYAVGLRESLVRCEEAIRLLKETVGTSTGSLDQNHMSSARNCFFVEMSNVFGGRVESRTGSETSLSSTLATSVLSRVGIDTSDPFHWTPSTSAPRNTFVQGRLGDLVHSYFLARDSRIEWLIRSLSDLLQDYSERIEVVEGFVYMECVGIQLEKFFSQKRSKALSAFEKKADLTTALNVATKKRMKKLVRELQTKLEDLGPISQTQVKESKDAHLESKEIKGQLHDLAIRRLCRVRETSTERVIAMIDLWAKEEELAAARELKVLGETLNALERSIGKESFDSFVYRYSKGSTIDNEQ